MERLWNAIKNEYCLNNLQITCLDPSSPIGRGWKSTFLTSEKSIAEKKCTEHGGTFEWLPNGCLKTVSSVLPAIRKDERTGFSNRCFLMFL